MGTAGVVCAAVVRAVVVGAAGGDALVAPFLADEEGESLGEFGEIGGDAVGADALVGEDVRVALVGLGCPVSDTRDLEADERACRLLVQTPLVPLSLVDGIGLDNVLHLGEDGDCAGEQACNG